MQGRVSKATLAVHRQTPSKALSQEFGQFFRVVEEEKAVREMVEGSLVLQELLGMVG